MFVSFRKNSFLVAAIVALTLGCVSSATAQTEILRVDITHGSPPPTGNGQAWGSSAFKFLQDALEEAQALIDEELAEQVDIWVAKGTYRPDQGDNYTLGDRSASFHLHNNVRILGGFPPDPHTWNSGQGATIDDRDPGAYETILDGDLEGDRQISDEPNPREQRRSINTATLRADRDINETAVIDGFTVTASGRSAFIATDARPWVLGCTLISSTSASAHLRGESIIVFHRCQFQSPMSEPILVDGGARAHCVGE